MRVACLPFAVVLASLVACGEVSSPSIDATVDTPIPIDAIDAPTDAALTVTTSGTGGTVTSRSPKVSSNTARVWEISCSLIVLSCSYWLD